MELSSGHLLYILGLGLTVVLSLIVFFTKGLNILFESWGVNPDKVRILFGCLGIIIFLILLLNL